MNDTCVSCGAEIPEGRQVCPACESGIRKPAPVRLTEHDFGFEYCCGGCGTLIAFTRHPIDDGLKSVKRYCTYCGRRINWNEIQRHSSTT